VTKAEGGKLMIMLDNCQWCDISSWDLIEELASVKGIILVLATRPMAPNNVVLERILKLNTISKFELQKMSIKECEEVVKGFLGVPSLPVELLQVYFRVVTLIRIGCNEKS
jgi:predicted ATPase